MTKNIAREDYIIRVEGCEAFDYRNQTKFPTLSELERCNIYSPRGGVIFFVEGDPNYTCNMFETVEDELNCA